MTTKPWGLKRDQDRRNFISGCGGLAFLGTFAACQKPDTSASVEQVSKEASLNVIAGSTRMRKSVTKLSAEELKSYANAIAAMRALPASHPHSLAAQAKIHGDSCTHGTWNFLSWHRAYLSYFEEVARKVTKNENFALPYWDWTVDQKIPAALVDASSPLYDKTREDAVLNNGAVGPGRIARAMGITLWEDFSGNVTASSSIEGSPHGYVHVAVGGNMSGFGTAGLDPLFWLHHCNLDRLWESWMTVTGSRTHPDKSKATSWENSALAGFWGRNEKAVSTQTKHTVQTKNFAYQYDELHDGPKGRTKANGVVSISSLQPSRFISGNTSSDVIAFNVEPGLQSMIANYGPSELSTMALTDNSSQNSVNGVSLIVEGNFENKDAIVVKASNGDSLESFTVFAHHIQRIHFSLNSQTKSLIGKSGKTEIALEVNGKVAKDLKVQLVVL